MSDPHGLPANDLDTYLATKRAALHARDRRIAAADFEPPTIRATVSAEGRSGVRRLRIREHQVISDSPPDFAGFDLGPSSPELQLGALGSCVTHIFLIQAAQQEVPLTALSVAVEARIDPRAGEPGHEDTPFHPYDIAYTVHVDSPASKARVVALLESVERVCPILNLLQRPQTVVAELVHTDTTQGRKPSVEALPAKATAR